MDRRPLAILLMIILTTFFPSNVYTQDFWGTYGNNLGYNYMTRSNSLSVLSQHKHVNMLTKSFSQSLSNRFVEAANDRKLMAIVCIFSREPEKCFLQPVTQALFDEVGFINAPKLSQKNFKKLVEFAKSNLSLNSFPNKRSLAKQTPRRKPFNLRLGYDLPRREAVISAPFYTYLGINIQPRYKTRDGFAIGMVRNQLTVDLYTHAVTAQYNMPNKSFKKKYIALSYSTKTKAIQLSNSLFVW